MALFVALSLYTVLIFLFMMDLRRSFGFEKNTAPRSYFEDCPGGPVVKTLPAVAEDTGSIPGPGRLHMRRAS